MIELFKSVFGTKIEEADGLNQLEREAIVDLLVLSMYSDNHIAMAESALVNEVAESFSWDAVTSFEAYINASIARVRSVKNDAVTRAGFIEFAAERIESTASKQKAVKLCARIFESDSDFSKAERAVYEEIKSGLQ